MLNISEDYKMHYNFREKKSRCLRVQEIKVPIRTSDVPELVCRKIYLVGGLSSDTPESQKIPWESKCTYQINFSIAFVAIYGLSESS